MFLPSRAVKKRPPFHVKQTTSGKGPNVSRESLAHPVSRESLADAELREDDVEQVFDINHPDDSPQTIRGQAQLFGP